MRHRSWAFFITMVFLWALNWSVMKRGLFIAPPFTFVFHRFLLSLGTLFVMLLILKPPIPRDSRTLVKVMIISFLNVGSFMATNLGLSSYSSGMGAVLTYSQPLIVFGLSVVFLNEETSKARLAGTVLGFIGVSTIFVENNSSLTLSLSAALMILGAFFWAANTVYYKRLLSHVDPIVLNVVQMAIGLPFLGGLSLTLESHAFDLSLSYLMIIIYAGVGASAVGTTLWFILLREEDATTLSGSSFIVPLMALVLGGLLLGEAFDIRTLVGATLVLVGVYLVNKKAIIRNQPDQKPIRIPKTK